jgi:hypothetical protein
VIVRELFVNKMRDKMSAAVTHCDHTMSTPTTNEVLRRHRNLTRDIRTRVSEPMFLDLNKLAKRRGLSVSDANREALAEYIEASKAKPSAK